MPTIAMGKSPKPEQSKSFTPTAAGSVITPDTGYTLSQVTVNGDADLVSTNIRSGVNIFGVAGNSNVVNTSAGDATAAQILSGKKAYVDGALVTGTIASKGAATYTPGTSNQTITSGQYLSGAQTISGDADLVSANIKSGANIFGVAGATAVVNTSDANAVAGNILSGKTAYVNGSKITGTIASKAAATYTPSTSNQTISAGQYLSGAQTIAGDADLVAGNIKSGANIFGVAGTSVPFTTAITSVQYGTASMSTSADSTVTISTVDPTKCLVILTPRILSYDSAQIGGPILVSISSTNFVIKRVYNAYPDSIYSWQVIEFSSAVIKSIQRGITTGGTISHSSVSLSKSFIIINNLNQGGYIRDEGAADVRGPRIDSRTTTSFTTTTCYEYPYTTYTGASWQLIEFY